MNAASIPLTVLNGSGVADRMHELSGVSQVIEMIDDVSELRSDMRSRDPAGRMGPKNPTLRD